MIRILEVLERCDMLVVGRADQDQTEEPKCSGPEWQIVAVAGLASVVEAAGMLGQREISNRGSLAVTESLYGRGNYFACH